MKSDVVEIPCAVLSSIETLDELKDWLTARSPEVLAELCAARKEDLAGEFQPWKPHFLPSLSELNQPGSSPLNP
ncbi:hypothetical protein LBMAG56_31650 [Verrucomicrobiota bacterium]|nr:hypothetical protein LBMAG56_31650 [Verrucomicrobiota bacterium]